MKMSGRKTSSAYELYGFIPQVDNGKHTALCTSCNRVLQNTAAIRLQKHRNSCVAARASVETVPFPNVEMKKHISPKGEVTQQNDSVNCSLKTEQSHMEFEDSNTNDNTHYEDTIDVRPNRRKRPRLSTTQNEKHTISHSARKKLKEPISVNYEPNEKPILSPVTEQTLQTEPFESYQATANHTSLLDMNEDIEEVNDEDLINIQDELNVLQNFMPRSKVSRQLQEALSKAETEYYGCKAAYFTKLSENTKIKRTLMLLESRKLQLEIEKLTNAS